MGLCRQDRPSGSSAARALSEVLRPCNKVLLKLKTEVAEEGCLALLHVSELYSDIPLPSKCQEAAALLSPALGQHHPVQNPCDNGDPSFLSSLHHVLTTAQAHCVEDHPGFRGRGHCPLFLKTLPPSAGPRGPAAARPLSQSSNPGRERGPGLATWPGRVLFSVSPHLFPLCRVKYARTNINGISPPPFFLKNWAFDVQEQLILKTIPSRL